MPTPETKNERCKYSFLDFPNTKHCCLRNGNTTEITPEICEQCNHFASRYIESPIIVDKITCKPEVYNDDRRMGVLVRVRPCDEAYENKTFLGIYLGDLPLGPYVQFNRATKELTVRSMPNPAIYVPEIKKIIFGAESWWQEITNPEEAAKDERCPLSHP